MNKNIIINYRFQLFEYLAGSFSLSLTLVAKCFLSIDVFGV